MIHVFVASIPTMSLSAAADSPRAGANWAAVRGFGTNVASLGVWPGFADRHRTSSKLSGS